MDFSVNEQFPREIERSKVLFPIQKVPCAVIAVDWFYCDLSTTPCLC